ncbi:MAG: hypothetical protein G01um101418_144 [Parcubacteria group bacterium Gr01-1014_18]|nr:MAG: hypothetical protein Greene041636_449 [Parcubacteria group bacterium Greene0416_36]TSC81471.1 MAG: hypothetical protein G01um101418_144 [Parcubacteria group bacterium Gr01-1014_18]TSC99069.1 MAG: hypothetical protein Greene101420_425 [Parcubacteria group bacterium Greene1014_20]TSD07250.1 MAG: hypothetical protein Greene07142_266 [Parcubacteria group bacterium Greene0714_2]
MTENDFIKKLESLISICPPLSEDLMDQIIQMVDSYRWEWIKTHNESHINTLDYIQALGLLYKNYSSVVGNKLSSFVEELIKSWLLTASDVSVLCLIRNYWFPDNQGLIYWILMTPRLKGQELLSKIRYLILEKVGLISGGMLQLFDARVN